MEIHIDSSVKKFIQSLQPLTTAKVLRTIDLLEKFGNHLGMPHSKRVSGKLCELRIRGQQEIRVFYCFYKQGIYLLHAFIKKSQKIPQRELTIAKDKCRRLTAI